MSKDIWLSDFDPSTTPTLNNTIAFIKDLDVDSNGDLIATDTADATVNLGKYASPAGVEQISITKDENGLIQSETTDGIAVAGRLGNVINYNYSYAGTGAFIGKEASTDSGLDPIVSIPATFQETSYTTALTAEGVRYTSPNYFSAYYSVDKILNGTAAHTTDGLVWATAVGSGDNYIHVEFPEGVLVAGFLFQNMRADYAVREGVVERLVLGEWVIFHTFDFTADVMGVHEIKFSAPAFLDQLRFRATAVSGTGGIGRLEFFYPVFDYSGTLKYKPLVIDGNKFDVNETESAIELSLSAGAGEGGGSGIPAVAIMADSYLKIDALHPANVEFKHPAIYVPRVMPLNTLRVDHIGCRLKGSVLILPAGTYKYRLSSSYGNGSSTIFYLADIRSGVPITRPCALYNNVTGGSTSFSEEGTLVLDEETPVALMSSVSSFSEAFFTPTTIIENIILASLDVWKLSNAPLLERRNVLIKPAEVVDAIPFELSYGSLYNAAQGRGLDDNFLAGTIYSKENLYWAGAGQYIIVKFDTDFRLWRYAQSEYPSYNWMLQIEKIEGDRLIDYTHKCIPITTTTVSWSRFTDTLPPGTYKFSYFMGTRTDAEWVAEKMPTGSAIKRPDVAPLIKNMTADSQFGQVATSDSLYSVNYPTYRAFDGSLVFGTDRTCWVSAHSASVGNPCWLSMKFPTPTTVNAYSIWNRSYNSAALTNSLKDWELQGRNGTDAWTTLHTVVGDTENGILKERFYVLDQGYTFEEYRLFITGNNGANNYVVVEEFQLYKTI